MNRKTWRLNKEISLIELTKKIIKNRISNLS
ncbi:hypothetical protein BB2000_1186 [Proteus mirabilis BB2000]|nr:hypothetical protein BB2000_1186 [Proteus mirabilis BB2000]